MQIKSGDNVIVITGKDKGKSAKVLRAFPRENKILVEGVNIKKKHQKSRQQGKPGQIVEISHPIHVSNVKKADAEAKPKAEKKPRAKKATKKSE